MATKEEIMAQMRAQLLSEKTNKQSPKQYAGDDKASYPFWNTPKNGSCVLRFLPDGDPNNTFFWVKREFINLPFDGQVGGEYETTNPVTVTVNSPRTWGEKCPIVDYTRDLWKDPATEELARTYWPKKNYIYQGFVVEDGIPEDETPENPIRRLVINPSIHEIIEKTLMDPTLINLPTDYTGGLNFRINKTKKGEYANYSTSNFVRNHSDLTPEQLKAIDTYGLFNLSDYLGKRPTKDETEMLLQMVKDSIDGKPFDYSSFGGSFRSYGSNKLNGPKETGNNEISEDAKVSARNKIEELKVSAKKAVA